MSETEWQNDAVAQAAYAACKDLRELNPVQFSSIPVGATFYTKRLDSSFASWVKKEPKMGLDPYGIHDHYVVYTRAEETKMKNFAFISRHTPTQGQTDLANTHNINLIPVGDMDAFSVICSDLEQFEPADGVFDGVFVVHPAAALRLQHVYEVGIFENSMRPNEGAAPTFEAKALHLFPRL